LREGGVGQGAEGVKGRWGRDGLVDYRFAGFIVGGDEAVGIGELSLEGHVGRVWVGTWEEWDDGTLEICRLVKKLGPILSERPVILLPLFTTQHID
jgi:hypothetical protein